MSRNLGKYSIGGMLGEAFAEINTENTNKMFGMRSVDALLSKIVEGHTYVASTRNRTLSNNGKINLLVKNPNGSNKTILILFIIDSEGKLDFKSYIDITVTASTPLTPFSLKVPKSRDAAAQVFTGVAFTGGALRADDLLAFGSGGSARGGSSNTIYTCIDEGSELFVELTNTSGQTRDVGFKVEIVEF